MHMAEISGPAAQADTDAILAFRPDRLGHALHLTAAQTDALHARPIPIEICPTSNIMTLHLQGRDGRRAPAAAATTTNEADEAADGRVAAQARALLAHPTLLG